MPKPRPKPDHDVAAVVAGLKAWEDGRRECPLFPATGSPKLDETRVPRREETPRIPALNDLDGLARLVGELRRAQKKYFRTRSPADLDESKRIEAAADRWLKGYYERPGLPFGE